MVSCGKRISSINSLPQDFATFFKDNQYSLEDFLLFISSLSSKEKVVFKKTENEVESKIGRRGNADMVEDKTEEPSL